MLKSAHIEAKLHWCRPEQNCKFIVDKTFSSCISLRIYFNLSCHEDLRKTKIEEVLQLKRMFMKKDTLHFSL